MSRHRHFLKAFLAVSAVLSTTTAFAASTSEVILNPPVASSVDALTIRKAFQLEQDPLVSITLKNAQVDVVMRSLAEKAGLSLVFLGDGSSNTSATSAATQEPAEAPTDDSAGGASTKAAVPTTRMSTIPFIDLKNVPLSQAFAFVLKLSGLSGRRMYNSLIIATPERLLDMGFSAPIVKAYQIYNSIQLGGASGAGGAAGGSIDQQLTSVLETRGIKPMPKIIMEMRTNTMIVMGTQEVIDVVDALMPVLDKAVPQVMVEIKLVELSKQASSQLGISYGFGQGKVGAGFNTGTASTVAPGIATPGQPGTGSSSIVTFNALSDFAPNFNAKLDALIQNSEAKVLTNPRIAIRHGIEGSFDAVTKVPIVNTQTTTTTATQTVSSLSIGESIKITPLIDVEHGFITMVIAPTISTRGATINLSQGPAPEVNERRVNTTLRVKDGGSVIIGGLMRQSSTTGKNKIPILGDIPLLGALFSTSTSQEEEVELVIIVTPHIMKDL